MTALLDDSLGPTTTAEENRKTAGQRQVNILWERTQAAIAVVVTLAYIYVSVVKIEAAGLANAFFLIVGFYFGRTNHTRTGGVGANEAGR